MQVSDLLKLAEDYGRFRNLSEATISNKACGHARLFSRLRQGRGCNLNTAQKAISWFSEHWPSDLAWPTGVDRPAPKRRGQA